MGAFKVCFCSFENLFRHYKGKNPDLLIIFQKPTNCFREQNQLTNFTNGDYLFREDREGDHKISCKGETIMTLPRK